MANLTNADPVVSKYVEQFVDHETLEPVREGETDGLTVVFYDGKALEEDVSILTNRAVFRPAEFIRKKVRGSPDVIDRVVRAEDIRAFPREYAAFRAAQQQGRRLAGTRLDTCTWVTPAQAGELGYLGIHTLEALAAAPEATIADADEAKAVVIESLSRNRPQQAEMLRQTGPLLPLWRQARECLALATGPAPAAPRAPAPKRSKPKRRAKRTGAKPVSVKGGR